MEALQGTYLVAHSKYSAFARQQELTTIKGTWEQQNKEGHANPGRQL